MKVTTFKKITTFNERGKLVLVIYKFNLYLWWSYVGGPRIILYIYIYICLKMGLIFSGNYGEDYS